jgi:conjugal transfer ATP-binding protein TraC
MSVLTFFGRFLETITGDGHRPDRRAAARDVPMLSDHLGYRAYDRERKIYHLTDSRGFILELSPMVGADDKIGDILTSIFADQLEPGCEFQVINYASPRIAEKLQSWAFKRTLKGGVFDRLARNRLDLLRSGAWNTLASDGPFCLRNFRILLSVGVRANSSLSVDDLDRVRDGVISSLDSIHVQAQNVEPTDLIRFIDDILCPSTGASDDVAAYSPLDPINEQCVRRDLVHHVMKDRVILQSPSLRPNGLNIDGVPQMEDFSPDTFDLRTFSVRNFPDAWAPYDTQRIVGDLFNTKLCLPCPVLQTISGVMPGIEDSETKAGFKFARTTSLADGTGAKLVPKIKTAAAEWERVQQQVRLGQKLISIYYAVTMISPIGRGDANARTLKAMYKAASWDLTDETYLHLMGLLAAMPLLVPDGLSSDLKRFKRFRSVMSENVASLAPLQGEYNGGAIPHLLLVGRRGQPQYWSPFQNLAGNHNVAIAGKSGSGKSVLLQDLTASLVGAGAKTIVIDDGRSFEHMAHALGARSPSSTSRPGSQSTPFA